MRPTVWRRALALAGAALIISTTVIYAADDIVLDPDGMLPFVEDSSAPSRNLGDVCVETPASGQVLLAAVNGNGSTWNNGATITVSSGGATGTNAADVTVGVGGDSTILLPSDWNSLAAGALSTDTAVGTFSVTSSVLGAHDANAKWAGTGGGSAGSQTTPNLHITWNVISCDSNTPPNIAADNASVTVTEGDAATNSGTVSDADGDSVDLSASVGSVTNNGDGTWDWSFDTTDGPSDSQTVTITADDGTDTSTATFALVVNNANPVVAAPSFSDASINCGESVDLTGISFSDAGIYDNPWNLNIDWGDGSTDYSDTNVLTQGAYADQSHTYNVPGTFTATVGVTDKDSGYGSNTSSNTVTVNQYAVRFLAPFDGSSPSNLITNTMKSGRVVPVKATIYDYCTGSYVTDPASIVTIVVKAAPAVGSLASNDAVEVYADAGASNSNTLQFRWSADATAPGGGFWIYNLDSKTAINGSAMVVNTEYRVDIFVGTARATTLTWALLKPVK